MKNLFSDMPDNKRNVFPCQFAISCDYNEMTIQSRHGEAGKQRYHMFQMYCPCAIFTEIIKQMCNI